MAREPWERKLAAERQRSALKQGPRPGSPTPTGERAREATAAAVGLKPSTYERGAMVLREAAPASMVARRCPVCGGSLDGMRAHARYCSGACRAEASRLRRLLDGCPVDGFECVADRLDRLAERKRTERGTRARVMLETIGREA